MINKDRSSLCACLPECYQPPRPLCTTKGRARSCSQAGHENGTTPGLSPASTHGTEKAMKHNVFGTYVCVGCWGRGDACHRLMRVIPQAEAVATEGSCGSRRAARGDHSQEPMAPPATTDSTAGTSSERFPDKPRALEHSTFPQAGWKWAAETGGRATISPRQEETGTQGARCANITLSLKQRI